ncbi:hypothetical protein KFE25_011864 [Diacronema lutheri]|uniref:Endonuclease/exonuclease/phosphatase domain-containing protein n=1 Tax=Diacronema lutheri TaxID=2081491 RepID=A0A8J6CAD6_DIALT|nr:hypothetical protein KFE25_011864 [Diacronema lutheri]
MAPPSDARTPLLRAHDTTAARDAPGARNVAAPAGAAPASDAPPAAALPAASLQPPTPLPHAVRLVSVNVWCHHFAALRSLVPSPRACWRRAPPRAPALMPMVPFGARLDAIADALAGADIVSVQELFVLRVGPLVLRGAWARFAERMAAAGLLHRSAPDASLPRFFGHNSGLALFSRWPLDTVRSLTFARTRERLNRKGALVALVHPPGAASPVVICVAHLDKRSGCAKTAQLAELGGAARGALARAPPERACALVLCGDFNVAPPAGCGGRDGDGGTGGGESEGEGEWAALVGALTEPGAPAAINGWAPGAPADLAPRRAGAWPRTHGGRTVDHAWLLAAGGEDGGGGGAVRFDGACEALRPRHARTGLLATDHAAVVARLLLDSAGDNRPPTATAV